MGPAASIREVIARIDALLARWEPLGDHRAVFARSYRTITIGMEGAITAGEFEDPVWMERLDIIFAQEYFDKIDAYERGAGDVPECWKIAFDFAREKRGTALQDLTLGMVAHIVHDLPIALFKAGIETSHRDSRYRDHQLTNDILARSIDQVQHEISSYYSFVLGILDRVSGSKDELLTDRGIRRARDNAWMQAIALTDAQNQTARDVLLHELRQTSRVAVQLLSPDLPWPVDRLIKTFRSWDSMVTKAVFSYARNL